MRRADRDRQPSLGRRAGLSQKLDLVLAERRPQQDVADAALGQVHDLGEHSVGLQRFLRPQMIRDESTDIRIRVAERPRNTAPELPTSPPMRTRKSPVANASGEAAARRAMTAKASGTGGGDGWARAVRIAVVEPDLFRTAGHRAAERLDHPAFTWRPTPRSRDHRPQAESLDERRAIRSL
jgi:hypothetical protein